MWATRNRLTAAGIPASLQPVQTAAKPIAAATAAKARTFEDQNWFARHQFGVFYLVRVVFGHFQFGASVDCSLVFLLARCSL